MNPSPWGQKELDMTERLTHFLFLAIQITGERERECVGVVGRVSKFNLTKS